MVPASFPPGRPATSWRRLINVVHYRGTDGERKTVNSRYATAGPGFSAYGISNFRLLCENIAGENAFVARL